LSPEIQARYDGIQVDQLPVAAEGVVSIQQDVTPRSRRDLRDQRPRSGIVAGLNEVQHLRQARPAVLDAGRVVLEQVMRIDTGR